MHPRLASLRTQTITTVRLLISIALLAIGTVGCGDNIKVNNTRPDSSITPQPDQQTVISTAKAITAFSFDMAKNAGLSNDVNATINGTTITATVPNGTAVTALVATFTTTGASVKIGTTTQVSGTTPNDFTSDVMYTVTAEDGSTQVYTVAVTVAAASAKSLTMFKFESAINSNAAAGITTDVAASITGLSITATVPNGTNVSALVATFETTGVSVKVGSTVQVSGSTANNFTSMVEYIVTAADNSTQTYTVIVSVAASSAKAITSFELLSVDNNPTLTIDVTAQITGNVITAIVPFNTDRSALVAAFATTGSVVKVGSTEQMSGETPNDFSSTLEYVVTAEDGSTQTYMVIVDNSQSNAKNITQFTIDGVDGLIDGTTITVTLPFGTNVTALVPTTISITGVSVSPGAGTPNDFTTPQTYKVTAADLTTKDYTVTVVVAGSNDKDITRFTINGLDAVIASTGPTTGIITLNMPNGTDLSNLTPIVAITGVEVDPPGGVPQNFNNTVNYVVTAQNGTTKTYAVNVGVVNGNGTKLMTSFTILGINGVITNGASSSSVTLVLPAGTDLTAQTPTVVINGSSLSPPSRVPQDFTSPVLYTVTASDGSTRVYTVTVTTL